MLEIENSIAVVVRGIRAFTSIGCNWFDSWESLKAGKSGIVRIQDFEPTGHKSQIASEMLCNNPEDSDDWKESLKMECGFSQRFIFV